MTNKSYRILIIDDNESIHNDIRDIIAGADADTSILENLKSKFKGNTRSVDEGYRFIIDSAYQSQDGINFVKESSHASYAVIIVDMHMPPGSDGLQTIKKIFEMDKKAQVVLCTAYSDYSWDQIFLEVGGADRLLVLKKPFDVIEMRQLIYSLISKWELLQKLQNQLNNLHELVEERTFHLQKNKAKLEQVVAIVKATLESTEDGIIVVNTNKQILDFNFQFVKYWNVTTDVKAGDDVNNILLGIEKKTTNPALFKKKIKDIFKNNHQENFLELHTNDGKILEFFSRPLLLENICLGSVFTFRDVTMTRNFTNLLLQQANYDLLTGLPNRKLGLEILNAAIKKAEERKQSLALLFLDLDRFKLVNDNLGHHIGDKLLKIVSSRIKAALRPSDIVARLGGDEFIIIANLKNSKSNIDNVTQRVSNVFKAPFNVDNHELHISPSIGICFYPENGVNAETLMKNADTAMYLSKEAGRNCINFYTNEDGNKKSHRMDIENKLYHAIENNELYLVYQPIIDLESNQIIGVESLLRWNQKELGVLFPDDFLPVAEENGLIIQIGEWVLRQACMQIKQWQQQGLRLAFTSVNLSANQFKNKSFLNALRNILKETQVDASTLALELTESFIFKSSEAEAALKTVNELGIQLFVDDFGTGYSNLRYFALHPIDALKIDKSFLHDIQNPRQAALIGAIISFGKSFKIKVIAEGVENIQQLQFLKKHHCDWLQGYYFSKPLTAEDCTLFLLNYSETFAAG